VVTGRVVDVRGDRARVELGEGVHGDCSLEPRRAKQKADTPAAGSDLGSMTAKLSARWKSGAPAAESNGDIRAGQIRSFRVSRLDGANKKIELALAD